MNISEVADKAAADVMGLDVDLAIQWTKYRYIELASIGPLKPFRRLYEVTIPAILNTGGMTTTRGSKVVTPNSAALAVLSEKIVGRYLRTASNWYEIAAYDRAIITLTSEWAEAAESAGTYTIVARRVELEKNIRWVGSFINMRTGWRVKRGSLDWLDVNAPQRVAIGGTPRWYAEVGVSDDNQRVLEFYPYDTEDALIRYTGYVVPEIESLNQKTVIPFYIDPHILAEGVLIDVMRRKMALAADAGQADSAALWRNDYRAQQTIWKQLKADFVDSTTTINDTEFILSSRGGIGSIDPDIKTGREERLNEWTSLSL